MNNLGLSIEVNRDAISQRQPVVISDTNDYISFEIENERLDSHTTKLDIDGLAPGAYSVKINGVEKSAIISTGSGTQSIGIYLDSSAYASIQIQLK